MKAFFVALTFSKPNREYSEEGFILEKEDVRSGEGKKESRPGLARVWKRYIPYIASVIALIVLMTFLVISLMNTRLIRKEIRMKAETLLESIILARRWNASFGGVFVEKKGDVQSNPYIKDPDISTVDGRVYTVRNPAMMTREISNLARESKFFEFKITSLKPLNPANRPSDFERKALLTFEQGKKTAETVEQGPELGRFSYRYMVPLYTEKHCLQCHEEQGYKIGSVRGGISVRFDMTQIKWALFRQKVIIWLLAGAVAINILGILYFLVLRLRRSQD